MARDDMEWISINDRLPESDQNMYHVYCKHYDQEWQMIVHYKNGKFIESIHDNKDGHWIEHKILNDFVTHWMPLPEPPPSLTKS